MKTKETLEEMVTRVKVENKANKKRIEQLEVKNAIYEETLEEIFELAKRDGVSWRLDKCYVIARDALNGALDD